MPKNVHFPDNRVRTGQQFVFFNSLKKDDPALANSAETVLKSNFSDIDIGGSADNKINSVINFFDIVIAREQKNEKEFMRRQQEKFKDMPLCKARLFSNKLDYMEFIAMINLTRKNAQDFSATIKNEKGRLKKIQEELKKEYKGKTSAQKNRMIEKTIQTSTASSLLSEQFKNELERTMAGINAQKIETALQTILHDPNLTAQVTAYIQNNFSSLQKNNKVSSKIILQYLTQALYKKLGIEDIVNNLQQVFDRKLDTFFKQNTPRYGITKITQNQKQEYEVKTGARFADDFLNRRKKGKSKRPRTVVDYIINNKNKEPELYKEIESLAIAIEAIKKRKETSFTFEGVKYSYKNGKYTIEKAKGAEEITYRSMIKRLKTRLSLTLKSRARNFLKQEEFENLFFSQIYVDVPNYAEIHSGVEDAVDKYLRGDVRVSGYLDLKNDSEFFVSYNPTALLAEFQKKKEQLLDNFTNLVAKEEEKARKNLSRRATTDTRLSADAFFSAVMKTLIEAADYLDEQTDLLETETDEVIMELGHLFEDGFYIQKSVKDIQFIDPDIGFKGGTLGANWQIALNNLFQMYSTGGLSTVDYEWMKFAILNCSSASLGGFLKNPIQKYLSFAAAMMMFNYGEAEIQRVAEELKGDLSHSYSPEFINLYVLNGVYFPSSYVLTLIRNGLFECQKEIERKTIKSRYAQSGVKIINKASPSWIDPKADPYDAEWFKIGAQTNSQIQIVFTFLAGFLDILNDLERKMNKLV